MITEGYFLEFEGAVWTVKGCYHPPNRVVALPRVFMGRKIKTMRDSLQLARRLAPLKYLPEIGREVPLVPLDEAKILDPFSWNPNESKEASIAEELRRLFPKAGVTGSLLYQGSGSDIDLISLRPEDYSILKDLRERGITQPLSTTKEEDIEVLNRDDMASLKSLRALEGTYLGHQYTFKIVECEKWEQVRRTWKFEGVVELNGGKTFTIPVKYNGTLEDGTSVEVTSFRTRFTELPNGTKLVVRGFLLERDFLDLNLDLAAEVKVLTLPRRPSWRDTELQSAERLPL
ncbi:hypothetical protein HS1genome_1211 [Sulfodiicoccus acidiphilus]|uniref:Polymerase nucleotidyl transferase domain-containing protein n=1 Tax=Sulfodiicoccus acidiphilus TaxID=1670455 RepID=A0A348B3S0_9CREN|nr:hypothetical protein [Sulfodiicoccus acidiphilus]BBD72822.1 hypothetical protein HS1genome_1211 [Sulfodiicoccus acidiphilus]GGU04215.1 hypothetical protein GCM10007116_21140 [Sulfodiicoccus acidiphilus]